jgi:transcriptional regulator with XRE-family HTH domain
MDFRNNLKKLRKSKKLSQTELAGLLGLSQRTISHYEQGGAEPSLECLVEIAKLLGVTTDELLGYTKEY